MHTYTTNNPTIPDVFYQIVGHDEEEVENQSSVFGRTWEQKHGLLQIN